MVAPQTDLDALSPSQLRGRRSLKWNAYEPDVLALWVAEMDYPTAPPILEALNRAVRVESFGYPLPAQASGLREATAAHLRRSHDWSLDPSGVHLVADVMRGVSLAIEHFSAADAPVVIPTPVYMPFFDVVALTGRPQVHVPLVAGALDLTGIEAALAAGAQTVILCNPHNPMGRVLPREDLLALAEVVTRQGARVVADEIHAPLVFEGQHTPYAALTQETASHTITVTSASKAWNVPGLKCAQVLTSNEQDTARWGEIPIWATIGVSTMGIEANLAAYERGGDWLEQVRERLAANSHLVAEAVEAMPGVSHRRNQATYLAWLDCTELDLPTDPAAWFLAEARVALSPGAPFRPPAGAFARLNFATTASILQEALERMALAVARRG